METEQQSSTGSEKGGLDYVMRMTSPAMRVAIVGVAAALLSASIAGLVSVSVNLWIVPSVQRQQRLADRRLEVLVEVAAVNADYYQSIWNVFFGLQRDEDVAAKRDYRYQVQRVSADAEGIRMKLTVLFEDKTIATDWHELMRIYHDAYYPLGRGEKIKETVLNEWLAPAFPLLNSIVSKIRNEMD